MNFINLPIEDLNVPIKIINQIKLELDINDFFNNDIVLISSGTATGKTRCIGKLSKDLKDKYKCNILSIVNLISLSREQITTFEEESKITLKDYQKDIKDFGDSDGVICINSLFKLENVKDFNISNTILYIDEVNDMIRTLTHNDGLDKVLNLVYSFVIKLIKGCKKIIFSDATIDQNTINLLSARKTNNKTILIKNTIQKFKDVKAIKYNDENAFIEELRNHIKNKKYFLFGSDGCEKISEIYLNLLEEFKDQKDSFLLFTSKQMLKVKQAKEQFKNKYVFYSPTITTGVSFVLEEIKQTHFMYFTVKPLITPISGYQMSCRTRNMKELIYYTNEIKPQKMKHETLKEVETNYKKMVKFNNRLLGMSSSRNEDDEVKIIDNTFFKLFCYNEYQAEIFGTGFINHYENILIRDGFVLSEKGNNKKLEAETKKEFNELYKELQTENFDDFVELYYNIEEELHLEKLKEYKILSDRTELLNIPSKEEANKYKIFLIDDYALKNYYNLLNLLKTSDYIKNKQIQKRKETFEIKALSTSFNKVLLLVKFEQHYKIDRFNFNFDNIDPTIEISDKFKELYSSLFPKRTIKSYKTKSDLLKIYVNIIKNICGDIPLIDSEKTTKNKKSIYKYKISEEILKDIIILAKYKNPTLKNYNLKLVEQLTEIKPDPKKTLTLGDDDDDLVNYMYNKNNNKQGITENIKNIYQIIDNQYLDL